MNEKIQQTLKSSETEDWLDLHVIRPFCYLLVRFFDYFDIHPNTVTILSMIIGAGSSLLFASGCYYYEGTHGLVCNLLAILLLMLADILDCTDGQLARLTGKKSRMGRILDGVAGFTWFFPIYVALVYRFFVHHDIEFGWLGLSDTPSNVFIATAVVLVLAFVSGIHGLAGQQRLADYYIQTHLFFLKGEKGSELDSSVRQRELYNQMTKSDSLIERLFQKSYISYTEKQERRTPQFQRLMSVLQSKYGTIADVPAEVREAFRSQSLKLMPWNGLLTFNFRSAWLFLFCLLDIPTVNFLFEIVAMGLLTAYINRRHEAFCRRLADKI